MHTEREGGGLSLGEAGKRGCSLPHVAILERILHAGIRDSLLRAGRAESIKKEREEGGGRLLSCLLIVRGVFSGVSKALAKYYVM